MGFCRTKSQNCGTAILLLGLPNRLSGFLTTTQNRACSRPFNRPSGLGSVVIFGRSSRITTGQQKNLRVLSAFAVQTITQGTNQLCKADNFPIKVATVLRNGHMPFFVPDLWDGNTAARITQSINGFINQKDSPGS